MEFTVGLIALVLPYLVGVVLTARHLVYALKVENEKHYRDPHLRGDDPKVVATWSLLFPVFWGIEVSVKAIEFLVFTGIKKTPGEIERERRHQEQKLRDLEREVNRMKKEQDGG